MSGLLVVRAVEERVGKDEGVLLHKPLRLDSGGVCARSIFELQVLDSAARFAGATRAEGRAPGLKILILARLCAGAAPRRAVGLGSKAL